MPSGSSISPLPALPRAFWLVEDRRRSNRRKSLLFERGRDREAVTGVARDHVRRAPVAPAGLRGLRWSCSRSPPRSVMPLPKLDRMFVPETSVPIKLPQITVPVVPLFAGDQDAALLVARGSRSRRQVLIAGGVLAHDGIAARPQADVDAVDLAMEIPRSAFPVEISADEVAFDGDSRCRRAGAANRGSPSCRDFPRSRCEPAAVVPPIMLLWALPPKMSTPLLLLGRGQHSPGGGDADEVVRDRVVVRAGVADVDVSQVPLPEITRGCRRMSRSR